MTASDAIEICRVKAEELSVPWDSQNATATRRRVWPFPAFWRVVSKVQRDNATMIMNVHERTHAVKPVQALYGTPLQERLQPWRIVSFCVQLIVSGTVLWLLLRYVAHQPVWKATLLAILGSWLVVMLGGSLYYKFRARKYSDEEEEQNRNRP